VYLKGAIGVLHEGDKEDVYRNQGHGHQSDTEGDDGTDGARPLAVAAAVVVQNVPRRKHQDQLEIQMCLYIMSGNVHREE